MLNTGIENFYVHLKKNFFLRTFFIAFKNLLHKSMILAAWSIKSMHLLFFLYIFDSDDHKGVGKKKYIKNTTLTDIFSLGNKRKIVMAMYY